MVEQNVWRNYQTKLLGGGLLLLLLIIIAALLSHYNHTPSKKKEIELSLEPQTINSATTHGSEGPVTTIEIAKPQLNSAPAVADVKPSESQIAASSSVTPPTQVPTQPALTPAPELMPAPKAEVVNTQPIQSKPSIALAKPMAKPKTSALTKPAQPTATASQKPVAKLTKPTTASPYSEAEKRILTIPKDHYTIQLSGANSPKNLQAFIKKYRLQNKASYFQTYNKGKVWYVIIYGNYKTKAQAQAALKNLPADLKQIHPWIRSYASLHESIQRKLS